MARGGFQLMNLFENEKILYEYVRCSETTAARLENIEGKGRPVDLSTLVYSRVAVPVRRKKFRPSFPGVRPKFGKKGEQGVRYNHSSTNAVFEIRSSRVNTHVTSCYSYTAVCVRGDRGSGATKN